MTTTEFVTYVNDALRGVDDVVPVVGSDEWSYWIRTLNRKKNELFSDPTKTFSESYAVANLGTIAAAASPSYSLVLTWLAPANEAYVINAEGHRTDLTIIKPEEQDPRNQQVFIAGQNPEVLYFTKEIEADDPLVGGTLYLPGYFIPADVVTNSTTATVPLPDPFWGVMAVAAEIAFGDVTYEDKSTDLNSKANALYNQMVKKSRRSTYNNPRKTPTNVPRIRGY